VAKGKEIEFLFKKPIFFNKALAKFGPRKKQLPFRLNLTQ